MLVSLALIAKNEAKMLAELLATHRDYFDETLVLDTGSTDGSPEVARCYGARVEFEPWQGDFALARNSAIERCHGAWILMLDADERLEQQALERLPDLVKSQAADAFRLTQRTYTDEAETLGWHPATTEAARGMSGYYDVELIRLFRRHPELRFEGIIHETLDASADRLEARVESSNFILHHYKERQSSARKAEKDVLYLELSREKFRRCPNGVQARLELAMAAGAVGHFEEAVEVLRPAVKARPDALLLAEHLGAFLIRAGRPAEVAPSLSASLARVTKGKGRLLSLVGEAQTRMGQYQRAAQVLEASLQLEPRSFRSLVNLGVSRLAVGELEGAEKALTRAAELCPTSDLPLLNLALCHKRARRWDEAEALFEKATELNPYRWQTHAHRAGMAFDRGQYDVSATFAARACALEDCGADAYLRACAAAVALGQESEARRFAKTAAAMDARHAGLLARLAA